MVSINKIFGNWTIIKEAERKNGKKQWLCKCACGSLKVVDNYKLKSGYSKSCGCLKAMITKQIKTTHGFCGTKTYNTWRSIVDRCNRQKSTCYKKYGMKGIKICHRWLKFENFLDDMGIRPDGMTIDRIDNNKGYEIGNCRWSTPEQQAWNKKNTKLFYYCGENKPLPYFAKKYHLSLSMVGQRIRRGWSIDKALVPNR